MPFEIIGGAVAAAAGIGAWMRWATGPVVIAFWAGRASSGSAAARARPANSGPAQNHLGGAAPLRWRPCPSASPAGS